MLVLAGDMVAVIVGVVIIGAWVLGVAMDMVVVMDTVMDTATDMVGVTQVGDTTLLIIQDTTLLTIQGIMSQLPMVKDTLTILEELVVVMVG